MLTRRFGLFGLMLALVLPACEALPVPAGPAPGIQSDESHIPPFARWPYQRFSRAAAVQIALREWRAFGQVVVVPHTELPFDNERAEGLWQRVGEYWWLGLSGGWSEQGWTGKHDANGRVLPEQEDGNYAWSAAFVDYVMRMAGAGRRFPYSPTHADYINAARQNTGGGSPALAITAERPESYAPQPGDLICMSRSRKPVRFDDLPAGRFPGHCDIVVELHPGLLDVPRVIDVIGGNVDNSVSMKHIPATPEGRLAGPDGVVLDPDYPWFVVIRIAYDIN